MQPCTTETYTQDIYIYSNLTDAIMLDAFKCSIVAE